MSDIEAAMALSRKPSTSIPEGIFLIEQYILAQTGIKVRVTPGSTSRECRLFAMFSGHAKNYFNHIEQANANTSGAA